MQSLFRQSAGMQGFSPDWVWFVGMVVLAMFVGRTPVKRPFMWAETYYHELSHGIAALVTGGEVRKINLHFNGAGLCTTAGGSRVFILLMGYAGASLWGAGLYMAGWMLGDSGASWWLGIELGVIAVTVLLWVRDVKTVIILALVSGTYALGWAYGDVAGFHRLLQFMGIYIMLNAIRAPLNLLDGQHVGDGAELASIFVVLPEVFWILLWFVFGVMTLVACGYYTLPGAKEIGSFVSG